MIDFTPTEEQENLREMAHHFAEREIRPLAWEYDRDATWPQAIIDKAWDRSHELTPPRAVRRRRRFAERVEDGHPAPWSPSPRPPTLTPMAFTEQLGKRPAPPIRRRQPASTHGIAPNGAREPARHLDGSSGAWIDRLNPHNPERAAAIEELHALLLRATRFEVNRRRAALSHLRGSDFDDVAHQSADDALVAVLSKLGDFRGESRFTTWVYKFALLEAGARVRRRAWQGREVPIEPDVWSLIADDAPTPQRDLETKELLAAVREAIRSDLTPHQRAVLIAVTLNDVPIDVLAERLETTRGALYKSIHDARRRLRAALVADGLSVGEYMASASS